MVIRIERGGCCAPDTPRCPIRCQAHSQTAQTSLAPRIGAHPRGDWHPGTVFPPKSPVQVQEPAPPRNTSRPFFSPCVLHTVLSLSHSPHPPTVVTIPSSFLQFHPGYLIIEVARIGHRRRRNELFIEKFPVRCSFFSESKQSKRYVISRCLSSFSLFLAPSTIDPSTPRGIHNPEHESTTSTAQQQLSDRQSDLNNSSFGEPVSHHFHLSTKPASIHRRHQFNFKLLQESWTPHTQQHFNLLPHPAKSIRVKTFFPPNESHDLIIDSTRLDSSVAIDSKHNSIELC